MSIMWQLASVLMAASFPVVQPLYLDIHGWSSTPYNGTHIDDEGVESAWLLGPLLLFLLIYVILALFFIPFARPIIPLCVIIVAILFPPLLLFLIVYLFIVFLCCPPVVPVVHTRSVKVVE